MLNQFLMVKTAVAVVTRWPASWAP